MLLCHKVNYSVTSLENNSVSQSFLCLYSYASWLDIALAAWRVDVC